ncbi:antitoxin [Cellulomonas soli]|uniref:antitoxin n=1 Tax=Cellulomonas soli TaxID=931535 RepID=UPI003F8537F8
MGIDDLVGKAKDALGDNREKVDDALDKAAEAVKTHTGDEHDKTVDSVVDKAKDFLDKQ